MSRSPYIRLGVMTVLSFVSMYVLMYAMVDGFSSIYPNLNQVYMAALMTAPMVAIEISLMSSMYSNKTANGFVLAAALIALVGFLWLIRGQIGIADEQFLKSMIPHHSGAILMCREASLKDADLKSLCQRIIASQQQEIDEMKARLASMR